MYRTSSLKLLITEYQETSGQHLHEGFDYRSIGWTYCAGLNFPQISLLMQKFALTAGLSSLGSPHFVVVAGLAELFSGAISMGVGGYLSTKAERDNYRYLLRQTRQRVETSCSKALEQEVFEILAPYGVSSTDCKRLVQSLEIAEKAGSDTGHADKGLTQFLLKFGTGAETISTWRLYASALTIGVSYFIGGLIPMVASSLAFRD